MSFGKRLKEGRMKKGLTQAKVAETIGVDDTTLSKYENDRSEPDNITLNKLATLYGLSLDYLQGRTDNPKPAGWTSFDEKLLKDFNSLNESDQEYILSFIERLKKG